MQPCSWEEREALLRCFRWRARVQAGLFAEENWVRLSASVPVVREMLAEQEHGV